MPIEFFIGWIIGCLTSEVLELLFKIIFFKGGKHGN